MGDYAEDLDTMLSDEVLACVLFLWDVEREARESAARDRVAEFERWASLYSQVADVIEADYDFSVRPHHSSYQTTP